jgi:transposase
VLESITERERNITVFEESVLRCVHHEHGGMTQLEAAIKLNVTEAMISRTISDIVKKAETCSPIRIMLPILTKRQFKVYNLIVKEGMSLEAIAGKLLTSVGSVRSTLHKLRRKGQHVPTPMKHEQYVEYMDDSVLTKF